VKKKGGVGRNAPASIKVEMVGNERGGKEGVLADWGGNMQDEKYRRKFRRSPERLRG